MIVRLALLTCGFYLAITFLLEGVLTLVTYFKGIAGIGANRLGWNILFGVVWLVSFNLAFRIVYLGAKAKLPH